MCYYYDKTFLGFLSLVFEIFKNKNWDVMILRENQSSLFQGEFVETNHENANRVYKKLLKIIGKNNLRLMYCSFLSEETNIELTLLGYIRQALKYGYSLPKHFTPEVVRVEKLSRRVSFEAHRFMGLVRFRKLMDDTYISVINPDSDILPLIIDHFTDRFSDQNFVIYDENRKRAVLYDSSSKQAAIKEIFDFDKRLLDMNNFELMHDEEKEYISLWKKFFESIAIEDRKNPKLQKSFMPEKYWKNLVEIE